MNETNNNNNFCKCKGSINIHKKELVTNLIFTEEVAVAPLEKKRVYLCV